MPRVVEFDGRLGNIPLERFRAGGREKWIVFSPDREERGLVLPEIFLELRVECYIGRVVLEKIKLHFIRVGTSQVKVIQGTAIGGYQTRISDAMRVLEARCFWLEEPAQCIAIGL